ncbi:tyrosine-type recombinase/integrase [Alphaproteobacteria bacterium]|nr:tyrosine-type recombinase/integrase [Alphaproteobacteria bacterium]
MSYYFRTQVAKLSIPKICFHNLRHTHISQLLNDGHPVAAVAKRAGHKNPAVTLRVYTHAMPGADEIMMEQFDEGFLVRDYLVTTKQKSHSFLRLFW